MKEKSNEEERSGRLIPLPRPSSRAKSPTEIEEEQPLSVVLEQALILEGKKTREDSTEQLELDAVEEIHEPPSPAAPPPEPRKRIQTKVLEAAWFSKGDQFEEEVPAEVQKVEPTEPLSQEELERHAAELSADEYRKYSLELSPPAPPPLRIVEAFLEAKPSVVARELATSLHPAQPPPVAAPVDELAGARGRIASPIPAPGGSFAVDPGQLPVASKPLPAPAEAEPRTALPPEPVLPPPGLPPEPRTALPPEPVVPPPALLPEPVVPPLGLPPEPIVPPPAIPLIPRAVPTAESVVVPPPAAPPIPRVAPTTFPPPPMPMIGRSARKYADTAHALPGSFGGKILGTRLGTFIIGLLLGGLVATGMSRLMASPRNATPAVVPPAVTPSLPRTIPDARTATRAPDLAPAPAAIVTPPPSPSETAEAEAASEARQARIHQLLTHARRALKTHHWRRAHQLASQALRLDPDNKQARRVRGTAAARGGHR